MASTEINDFKDLVLRRFDRAYRNQEDSFEDAKEYRKLYMGEKPKKPYKWQSNYSAMEVYATVESAMPKIMRTVLPPGNVVRARARPPLAPNDIIALKRAKLAQNLVNYEIDEIRDFFRKSMVWFKGAVLYPYSIAKVGRDYYFDPDRMKVMHDRIQFDPVNYFDFFYCPGSIGIYDSPWVIHRIIRSREHLERLGKNGLYHNIEKALGTTKPRNYYRDEILETTVEDPADDVDREYELLEYHDGKKIFVICNREEVIRDDKNKRGWKPFIKIEYTTIPFSFPGLGIISPLEKLALELDDLKNIRTDRWNQIILPINVVSRYSGIMPSDIEKLHEPGFTVVADDINGLREYRQSDTPISSYREEEILIGNMQRVHGQINMTSKTNAPAVNDTATGIQIVAEEISARLALGIQNFGLSGIVDLAEKIWDIEKDRITGKGKWISVDMNKNITTTGPSKKDYKWIGKADLDVNVRFEPMWTLEASNRAARQQELMLFYDKVSQNQIYRRPALEEKLLRKLVDEYEIRGVDDKDFAVVDVQKTPPQAASGGLPGAEGGFGPFRAQGQNLQ